MKVINRLDGMPLDDGYVFRAPREVHTAFKIPRSEYPSIGDGSRVELRGRSWEKFLVPTVLGPRIWIENSDGVRYCPHSSAIVTHRPEIFRHPGNKTTTRLGARIGFGFHCTTGRREMDYADLFAAVHGHAFKAVDTLWLADQLGLKDGRVDQTSVDINIREALSVGSLETDWVLWVTSNVERQDRSALKYTLEYCIKEDQGNGEKVA